MFRVTHLVHLNEGAADADKAAVAEALRAVAPTAAQAHAAPTLPGVFNGGDVMAHHAFADKAAWDAAKPAFDALLAGGNIRHFDRAGCAASLVDERTEELGNGVYRALFLAVKPGVDPARQETLEYELSQMPHYIKSIRNWRLSRVDEAAGARGWTHVWEQEYADIDGLNGPYMIHPYHWARVDRWFDPECEDWIVDTLLCHSFGSFEQRVV